MSSGPELAQNSGLQGRKVPCPRSGCPCLAKGPLVGTQAAHVHRGSTMQLVDVLPSGCLASVLGTPCQANWTREGGSGFTHDTF